MFSFSKTPFVVRFPSDIATSLTHPKLPEWTGIRTVRNRRHSSFQFQTANTSYVVPKIEETFIRTSSAILDTSLPLLHACPSICLASLSRSTPTFQNRRGKKFTHHNPRPPPQKRVGTSKIDHRSSNAQTNFSREKPKSKTPVPPHGRPGYQV